MEYIKTISVQKIDEYIDVLTSKIYSVLPLYEEHCSNIELNKKIGNLIALTNGFLIMLNKDSKISIEILSYLYHLQTVSTHKEVRSCVLTSCALLQKMKDGD